jgi:hypothetical protein
MAPVLCGTHPRPGRGHNSLQIRQMPVKRRPPATNRGPFDATLTPPRAGWLTRLSPSAKTSPSAVAVSGALMVDGSAVPRRRVVVVLHHLYASSDLVLLIRPGDTVDYGGVVGARAANNGVLCVSLRPRRYMNGLDGGYTEPSKGE